MLESAAHTVFATPELALLVSAHLNPHDLTQCMAVCKVWSHVLEPILWTDFCLKDHHDELLSDSSVRAALIRNQPHIRTIKFPVSQVSLLHQLIGGSITNPSTRCTGLRRIEFENISASKGVNTFRGSRAPMDLSGFKYCSEKTLDFISVILATLLDLNDRLTHLKLPRELMGTKAALAALSKLENLQHLTVASPEACHDNQPISRLLQACLPLSNLTELHFDFDMTWENHAQSTRQLETIIKKASMARFSQHPTAAKIKSLKVPSNRDGDWNPLPLLLLKSDLLDLKFCELPWFDKKTDPEDIEEVVRKHCSNLKHLTYLPFNHGEPDGFTVDAFISGCSGLQSFTSDYVCDEDDTRELKFIIAALVQHHADTMEVIEFTRCSQVYGDDQQYVLSQCKQLKQFWVTTCYGQGTTMGIRFPEICTDDWVCLELTKLGLTFDPFINHSFGLREVQEPEVRAKDAKRVYAQLGRLHKLEVLSLAIDTSEDIMAKASAFAWDLTLSKGWLGEMAGLKNLKSLSLQAEFWSKIGQAEVEFMHEHWPSLSEICLWGRDLRMSPRSPWFWLLSKRPQLRLDHKYRQ